MELLDQMEVGTTGSDGTTGPGFDETTWSKGQEPLGPREPLQSGSDGTTVFEWATGSYGVWLYGTIELGPTQRNHGVR